MANGTEGVTSMVERLTGDAPIELTVEEQVEIALPGALNLDRIQWMRATSTEI